MSSLVTSTSTTAASAPEAAVTMLRVYCSWPGASPMMNLRLRRGEVAVRDVDGDALLALGRQAVGEQRQVGLAAARCTPAELVLQHGLLSTSRRPISVLLPSSTLPQVMKRSARMVVRPCTRRGGLAVGRGPSEIPVLLALFHRGVGGLVVHAGGAALADVDVSVSATTSAALAAGLSTGQVQVMSPTVRKRTVRGLDLLARPRAA